MEGAKKKHELEHEKCHGGSEKKARTRARKVSRRERKKKHELEHEKCHGGSEKKGTN